MLKQTYNRKLAESVWWNLLLLTVGGSIQAICLQCISPQHEFLATGLMGMSLLAHFVTDQLSVSVWYFLFSVPLFIVGRFCVSKRFLLYTLYGTCVTTIAGSIYNHFGYVVPVENELYAAVLGGVLLGTGGGIMLRSLGSGGALDIISVTLRNRWNIAIGQFSLCVNLVVFSLGYLMGYDFDRVMASIIMIFINSRMMETVLGMFNHRKLVLIISDRGEEVAMDVLAAAQPAKLYILIGTNALVQTGNDESFLNYYGRMLDELRTALPNTALYVQSILTATQETVNDDAPGLAPDRLATINAAIQGLCAERGCYFLDLNAEFSDDSGYLLTDYAQPDGVHLTVSGYNKWVSYLCTHVPYNKNNPYQAGSTYYLSDDVKELLADLP